VTATTVRPDLGPEERRRALISCAIFAAAIVAVVLIGIFPDLRPVYTEVGEGVTETGQVEMGRATMIVMLAAAGLLLLLARSDPEKAIKGGVMKGGLSAVISILGVSWMGSSFFEGNRPAIVGAISSTVESYPWVFAVGLFVLSLLLFSQAAAVAILGPVAVAIGLPAPLLLGAYPAVNGNFFLPTYGTVLAAVAFDQTGTTRIGRFLVNHSFMRPGLVATGTSTAVALGLARAVL
jgi:anaerobic C4-dicarboxylate transporter DcuA